MTPASAYTYDAPAYAWRGTVTRARGRGEVVQGFKSVDPLAASFPSWSAYNFALNSPLRFRDSDGRAPDDIIVENTKTKTVTRVVTDDDLDVWVRDGVTIETDLSKQQTEGRIGMMSYGSSEWTANQVDIAFGADADPTKVSNYSVSVLVDVANATDNSSMQINSTARTPEGQARVMAGLVDADGMAKTKALYGRNGDLVLDEYPDVTAMVEKIYELGPSNVSKHIADPDEMNVVDVSPWRNGLQRPQQFSQEAEEHPNVSRVLSPYNSNDKAIHIEIPQPQIEP